VEPLILVPHTEGSQTVVVRTSLTDPQTLVAAVRAIVHQMDARVPAYQVQTLDSIVTDAFWRQRLQSRVLSVFAVLALTLAVFGIYAVISYAVAQRTRELGVRMALGATSGQVLVSVLAQAGRLAAVGIALGTAAALGLTRLLSGMLYNVQPTDPATFAGVALVLIGVAVVATVVPARRAARIDPLIAMRAD
jgi:putative ABC transport system permease protein